MWIHFEVWVLEGLDPEWSGWCEGLTVQHDGTATILKGDTADIASVYDLLTRLLDLRLTVVYVNMWPWMGVDHGDLLPSPSRNGSRRATLRRAPSLVR